MILLIFIFIGLWLLPSLVTYMHLRAVSPLLIACLLGWIWFVVSLPFLSKLLDKHDQGN